MITFVITFAGAKTSPLPFLDALTELENMKKCAMAQQQIDTQTIVVAVTDDSTFHGSAEITLPSVHAAIDTPEWEKRWANWEAIFDQSILFVVAQR